MAYHNSLEWWDYLILYVLGVYGLVYLFLPHSLHQKGFAIDWLLFEMGLPHIAHVSIGAVMIILTIGYYLWRR